MSDIQELFKHTKIDKVQVIQDLLEKIEHLEYQVWTAQESVKTNGQIAIDTINREKQQHNEELQKHMDKHAETLSLIQRMDEIAAENTIMVKCRKCDCHYELPCDLSEFDPEYSYCGKGGPSPCTP
ncbi:hypothetical protein Roomu2_00128 [Pseudomonas phage vB_PpuM-Roomu-2]|uniref:Uncharacterized protein n=2 Tax=Tartuvirus TaxID=3424912 RepID=A0AAX4MYM7_9CAUD